MRSLLKEPLLHFLLIGVILFAAHEWRGQGTTGEDVGENTTKRIEVTAEVITRLKDGWSRQFQKTPDEVEVRGIVEAHVTEEILYREALALGLDRNDTIVRRRLAQKMEFLTQDIVNTAAPDEATLEAYFKKNAAKYARPSRVSFRHVYFSEEKRGENAAADARMALTSLSVPGASEDEIGDGFLHGFEFVEQDEQDIATVFGPGFARDLLATPEGVWRGPLASSYGDHLVIVTGRGEPKAAEFSEVRSLVLHHLLEDRRLAANAEFLEGMRKNYTITIDEEALKAGVADLVDSTKAER